MSEPPVSRLQRLYRRRFETEPHVAVAPGRVNLIGEHTDYNDGFVLPAAIDRYVAVGFRTRTDRRVRIYAADVEETRTIDLDRLPEHPSGADRTGTWVDYPTGVLWQFHPDGDAVQGLDMALTGDIPVGAGLSSSAALEVAVATALIRAWNLKSTRQETARGAQRAENEYVGVACGIMDQYAVAAGRAGRAVLLDCRSLEARYVPPPASARILILDTGVRRSLDEGSYNRRVAECRAALEALRREDETIRSLRDVDSERLERSDDRLDEPARSRARHVVRENERVHRFAGALEDGDLESAGQLLDASHRSLAELYEVSSPELDFMARTARDHPACHGARLTGAGLGGCVVALVERGEAEPVAAQTVERYSARFDHPADGYPVELVDGAHVVD